MLNQQVEYYDSLNVDNPTYWNTARFEHLPVHGVLLYKPIT